MNQLAGMETLRSDIANINEETYLRCSSDPTVSIRGEIINQREFRYFCTMNEHKFRLLLSRLDPFKTWITPDVLSRQDFFSGLHSCRTMRIPDVGAKSLEFDFWFTVHQALTICPECVTTMFGLESWLVSELIAHKISFKELLFITSRFCHTGFRFILLGIDHFDSFTLSEKMVLSNYRLSSAYLNSPAGAFRQWSVIR